MKQLLILAAIALIATILTACENSETVMFSDGTRGYFDTVDIHGHPHEFIQYCFDKHCSTSHSPECWCLKGDSIQPIEKLEQSK